ncbi:MAG: hypothetical protein KTR20_10195 [Cellvibrionaceae bacterium]|nr:hypothetical protein [Cellvibrionaceae bacterium]
MTEQLVVQLVDETAATDDDSPPLRQFRWGFVDDLSDWLADSHSGDEAAFLSALAGKTQPLLLLLPGYKLMSVAVPYNKKEARHFLKLLPYQLEDDVLGNVDELHFAVADRTHQQTLDSLPVAYVDNGWFSDLLQWFQDHHMVIEHCMADFQALQAVGNELVLWFTDGYVWGHRANGLGFSVAQNLSQALLNDVLVAQQDVDQPWRVRVYVADNETREIIDSHIMPPVDYEVVVGHPPLDFHQPNRLNFLSGQFGKNLPLGQWWQQVRSLAALAAVAVAVFFVAVFADIYGFQKDRQHNQQAMLKAYRSVVPQGPSDSVLRRLKAKLGPQVNVSSEPSSSVYLLSKIAPVLDSLKINLANVNYSHRERALRINIKAASFNGIEQFRQQLSQQGVQAQLQSSNAVDEGFQARLRIILGTGEQKNG